jgi:type IV fimbrial biogenesis protein FimT
MNSSFETCRQRRGAGRGFTLIEVLVTITVAGILMAMAVPAFNSFVQNDRDVGQVNSLVESLNYARSESIKRASPSGIEVCPSTDAATCNGTTWSGGWIVLDLNAADPPPLVLQTVPALNGSNTISATGGGAGGITFLSSGLVSAPLTVKICDPRGATFARDVEVNATGRVAASQTPGQSVAGAALTCP